MLFQNIDGNKSNFDTLAIYIQRYEIKNLYKLTNYDSFYQEKVNAYKKKGTGVALYSHNSLNAVQSSQVSKVSETLETLFVTLTNRNTPITIGVIYRPPNGDIDKALSELATILDDLPQYSYVAGDFNIDK